MKNLILGLILLASTSIVAQERSVEHDQIAADLEAGFSLWSAHDAASLAERDRGVGFGFRTRDARPPVGREAYRRGLERFFAQMESYTIELDELHTKVDGDVVLAWGFFIENYQLRGQPPERARVRFTSASRITDDGLKPLIFHRDIQPFDETGRYLQSLTRVE